LTWFLQNTELKEKHISYCFRLKISLGDIWKQWTEQNSLEKPDT